MKSLASLHYATPPNQSNFHLVALSCHDLRKDCSGFVLPSVLGMIGIMGIATATALNLSATQIRIIQSEKQYFNQFKQAEIQLVSAEKRLVEGLDASHLAHIESFKPKYFRNKSGVTSHHYRITTNTPNPSDSSKVSNLHKTLQLQSTLRIDEHHSHSNTKTKKSAAKNTKDQARHAQRLGWRVLPSSVD